MKIIDTHCHFDLEVFDPDRDQILSNCAELNINRIIVPAIQSSGWQHLISVTTACPQLEPALGLHPVFIESHQSSDIEALENYITQYQPVAVGEIGLDFFIENTDREKQKKYFEQQLVIAEKHQLPVILHVRKAHDEVLTMLKKRKLTGGTCHAFNGSFDQARQYMNLGFKLGFGGTLTYPNARKIHQLAKQIPLESIVLETDAPDMSGFHHKGERNQPDFIIDALNALAEIKNQTTEEVANQTTLNATALFNL